MSRVDVGVTAEYGLILGVNVRIYLEMLLLVLLLILWPSSILGLLLLNWAELESRGWRIYRGNAAEILVDKCYFENLLLDAQVNIW